mgnify:CR=1 FL=1
MLERLRYRESKCNLTMFDKKKHGTQIALNLISNNIYCTALANLKKKIEKIKKTKLKLRKKPFAQQFRKCQNALESRTRHQSTNISRQKQQHK